MATATASREKKKTYKVLAPSEEPLPRDVKITKSFVGAWNSQTKSLDVILRGADKPVIEYEDNSHRKSNFLYSGEAQNAHRVKRAIKLLRKNKLEYEFADNVFTLYAELFEKEYYRELKLLVQDECWVLTNGEFSYQYYCAELNDLQELIDYVIVNYRSKYSNNGLILTN